MRKGLAVLRTWLECAPLGWVLLLAGVLRLVMIQSRGLQYDDVFTIFLSSRSLPEIISGTAADTMPPLYYFLLHFWMLAGQEVWWVRLLSILINLCTIAMLYGAVELWFGRAAAIWAGLLAAVSPLQIYHAQDVRMYALLAFGQMGVIFFFTRIWFHVEQGRKARWPGLDWAGLVLSGLIAMYSHNLAVFAFAAPVLFLVLRRRWKLLSQLLLALAVVGVGALPWLVMLPGQLNKIQRAFWTPRPGPVEIIQVIIQFTGTIPLPNNLLLGVVTILSFQILLVVGIELWHRRREVGVGYLTALLLTPPVLLFLVSYLMRPVFVARGMIVASLAYYGLCGFVIASAWQRGAGKLVAGAFILAVTLSLPSFYSFNGFPRSPYEQAMNDFRQASPDAYLIHETKLSFFPAYFYAPEIAQVFLVDEPGSANDTFAQASQEAMHLFPQANLEQAIGDRQDFYFVTFTQVFNEYQQAGLEHPRVQWLEQQYRRVDRQVYNDLEIYHYAR